MKKHPLLKAAAAAGAAVLGAAYGVYRVGFYNKPTTQVPSPADMPTRECYRKAMGPDADALARDRFEPVHITAQDGTPLAAAGALWVMLDTKQRRIVSPQKVDLGFPDNSDLPAPVALPTRLPALRGETPQVFNRTPQYSDFDVNGHVNNTKYIAWLCDALGFDALRGAYIGDLVAGYEKEIRGHDALRLTLARQDNAFSFQIASAANEKHFVAGGTLRPEG